jgi:hypothetical protein
MADDWISVQDAVKLSGYHTESIRELVRDGKIKGRKVITVWLVSRTSLQTYLRGQAKRGEKRGPKSLT